MVDQLKDIGAGWNAVRRIRDSAAVAKDKDPAMSSIVNAPNADIYVIDVSFKMLADKSERHYLNQLPTSFALSDEAVDRLRAAPLTIIFNSPEIRQVPNEGTGSLDDTPITG